MCRLDDTREESGERVGGGGADIGLDEDNNNKSFRKTII